MQPNGNRPSYTAIERYYETINHDSIARDITGLQDLLTMAMNEATKSGRFSVTVQIPTNFEVGTAATKHVHMQLVNRGYRVEIVTGSTHQWTITWDTQVWQSQLSRSLRQSSRTSSGETPDGR